MKKVLRNSIVLMAFLLIVMVAKATVIGGTNGTTTVRDLGILGCDGGTDQQAKGVKVSCTKRDGTAGEQCVSAGQGTACDLKVIECL